MSGQDRIEQARRDVDQARRRLAASIAALQFQLPGRLVSKAWKGVREKSEEVAEEALQAVKMRPAAAGGAVATFFLLLARKPLGRLFSSAFSSGDPDEAEDGTITADLEHDEKYDLTAPVVARPAKKGAKT